MTLKQKWMKLRNFQSQDFWAMVFARPLTILFLLPIIDKKWVTPDRITVASVISKLIAIYMIAFHHSYQAGIWGALLINLGLILDNMDGTVARYRNCGTQFGYFFDKATDAVTFVLLFWAMGYRAWLRTEDILDLILPFMGVTGAFIANYSKWVAERVFIDLDMKKNLMDNTLREWAEKKTKGFQWTPPPERSLSDWVKWLGKAVISILQFNEVDIYFWSALALITEKFWIFTKFNSFFLSLGLIGGPVLFTYKIYKRERDFITEKNRRNK